MAYKDPEDQKNYYKIWYKNNKEKKRKINKKYKQIRKEMVFDFKKQQECPFCGESYYRCLDFHHYDEEEKEDQISSMLHRNLGLKKIVDEMNKCCVLCSNCHKKVHDGVYVLPECFKLDLNYLEWEKEYKKRLKEN